MSWCRRQRRNRHARAIRTHQGASANDVVGLSQPSQNLSTSPTITANPRTQSEYLSEPRRERMNGPSNSDKHGLEKRSTLLERSLIGAGALVVIGLLGESRTVFAWFVTVGVATEVLLGIFITKTAEEIRKLADEEVAAANDRAANAQKAASEADLKRAQLAQKFKWRTLTPDAYIDLQTALSPLAGTRLDIFAFDSERGDTLPFAYELANVSRRAGLDCKLWVPSTAIPRMRGIRADVLIASAKECTPEENERSSAISMAFAQALVRSGIKANTAMHGFLAKDPISPDPAPTFNPWNPNDVAPFRIQIVERELLDGPFGP